MNVLLAMWGAFAASIAWFIVGGILYMNPYITKLYKNVESSPALKKWENIPGYLGIQYAGILVQCVLWALVFAYIADALPDGTLMRGIAFGSILTVIKIIPRSFDMWIQTMYPKTLLAVEVVNGVTGSFVIGMVFAYII